MDSPSSESLQQQLVDLLVLLQDLNPVHLSAVCQFINHDPSDLLMQPLLRLLRQWSPGQIEHLITLTVKNPSAAGPQAAPHNSLSPEEKRELEKVPTEVRKAFGLLLQLYELAQMLNSLTITQLVKMYEIIPPGAQVRQLQILQQLQQLLGKLLPEVLLELRKQVTGAMATESDMAKLLGLKEEHFHLYQPLRQMLQLEPKELLGLQDALPKLSPTQMIQLLSLLGLQQFDLLEIKRVLSGAFGGPVPMEDVSPSTRGSHGGTPMDSREDDSGLEFRLKIVEQPPEKSVYKRNLKPNPMVQLVVDESKGGKDDSQLYIAPTLIRCDNHEELPKLISGNKPVKVAPGRVAVFRRLKILQTSHQQGESLFAIKFELRRYQGNKYEVLDFAQSNPICVLSHSTQLKPVASTTSASITEVIPYNGPLEGGTRVAILGSNFIDSPSARVRFDQTDVLPTFHGPKTLVCVAPPHPVGMVTVRVSNDSRIWSTTTACYSYEEQEPLPVPPASPGPPQPQPIPSPGLGSSFNASPDVSMVLGNSDSNWTSSFDLANSTGDPTLLDSFTA